MRYAITPFEATQHRFCAKPVEYQGCPYCPTHAAVCFDRRGEVERREEARVWRALKLAQIKQRIAAPYEPEEDAA